MTDHLIPGHEWHPLDGVPPPEYIPPNWDGVHVGKRLIEAFRTLARLPAQLGPCCNPRTAWPGYRQEVGEYFAALVGDAAPEIVTDRNRVRLAPTAEDIMRMEAAIVWPARYLADRAMFAIIVQEVARRRAMEWALEDIARKLRRSPTHVRRCNRIGLDRIASGLRRGRVAVF